MIVLKRVFFSLFMMFFIIFLGKSTQKAQDPNDGHLILAYKGFDEFLNAEHTYENYQKMVVEPYPAMRRIHEIFMNWGAIDTISFPQKVCSIDENKYREILSGIDDEELDGLFKSIVSTSANVLPPLAPVDVCFYLTLFGDCNAFTISDRKTVAISLHYPMEKMPVILAHEYAHCLHFQRRPSEEWTLKRSIIAEGIACYYALLLSGDATIHDALWMLNDNVEWCINNEDKIIEAVIPFLNGNSELGKKYFYAGGRRAEPPEGFPEKTGYYLGYRIVESCLNKGISLEELCSLDAQTIIYKSSLFTM